jgi:epidermal growth factor receptor substrate 15
LQNTVGFLKEQVLKMGYFKVRLLVYSAISVANRAIGEIVKASWEKSGLPESVLSHVWNLCDTEQRGALSQTEFIIAMHLLASYKAKTLTALPQTIPAGLYEAASRRPTAISARTPGVAPIPRQTSGPGSARAPARQFTPPVSQEWVIGPREKTGYDTLFDKVDTQKLGYISGDQAVVFFSESGLPSEVLAQIWDLSNTRRLDQLNRDEFAVAMYLIRNQGRKPQSELPSELPTNLIPPSLRGAVPSAAPSQAPEVPPVAPVAPVAPPPTKSNVDDLFGLDSFTSSPSSQVKNQTTGGSANINRSSDLGPFGESSSPRAFGSPSATTENTFFKSSFAPTSSFGQALATQSTGASASSSSAPPKQASLMEDLLGDNDPEVSKKFTKDTTDLANMQNEIGQLRSQMQNVQNRRGVAENELVSSSTQKRELESRLQQFRSQYEQEVKSLKALEDQLGMDRNEINQLGQKVALTHASAQDVQSKHRDVQGQLQSTQQELETVKERLRQMNEYIKKTQPEIEKMQSELRQQKGLLAIHKKQAEKLEEEKGQLDRMKADLADLSKAEGAVRPPVSREVTSGSAVSPAPSTTSSTNPFMRRSPQASVDNTMSPSGFTRTMSQEGNKFDNIFSQAFNTPTTAPTTSFHQDAFSAPSHSSPSVKSSKPEFPTPSTSPPQSSYQESPQLPPPPAARQITSKDLPLGDKSRDAESAATSVRVETPLSRYDMSTPTNPIPSSPQQPSIERADTARSGPLFDHPVNSSSPVVTPGGDATKKQTESGDIFQGFGTSREAASPVDIQPSKAGMGGHQAEAPPPPRSDPFALTKTSTGSKGDIEAAFASVGKSSSRQVTGDSHLNGNNDPVVAKFNSEFPPINMKKEEFPPIKSLEHESDTESEVGGFDDDFTKASPPPAKKTHDIGRTDTAGSHALDSFFSSPPSSSAGAFDFGAPLSSAPKNEPPKPAAPSHGESLFGSKSSTTATGMGSSSMFSASPPETNRTSNQSDTYESAVSRQSSTNKDFSPTEASTSTAPAPSGTQAASNAPKFSGFDEFSGFDDLADAKEADDRADDDLIFDSHHGDDHEFSPSFDSPNASASHLAKSAGASTIPSANKSLFSSDDTFGDFEHNFGKSLSSSAQHAASGAAAGKASTHDWDAMMKGIEVDDHHAHGSGRLDTEHDIMPEAPEPPKSNLARMETTEHDDPILKRLTSMGYPRPLALAALEKFDYDLDKVR